MLSCSDSPDEAAGLSSGLSVQGSKVRNTQDYPRCRKNTCPALVLARGPAEPPACPCSDPTSSLLLWLSVPSLLLWQFHAGSLSQHGFFPSLYWIFKNRQDLVTLVFLF